LLTFEELGLKIGRNIKGLTKGEAADLFGIAVSAWSSAERGVSRCWRLQNWVVGSSSRSWLPPRCSNGRRFRRFLRICLCLHAVWACTGLYDG